MDLGPSVVVMEVGIRLYNLGERSGSGEASAGHPKFSVFTEPVDEFALGHNNSRSRLLWLFEF